MKTSAILLLSCPDRKGVVATIADFVFRHGGNILHADEHADEESNLFLMRVEFDPADFDIPLDDFRKHISPIAEKFEMTWRLARSDYRPRMAILVSKYDHCLVDLLYRHKSGELNCDIPLIISNHPDNQPMADFYKIPYFTVPVPKDNKRWRCRLHWAPAHKLPCWSARSWSLRGSWWAREWTWCSAPSR